MSFQIEIIKVRVEAQGKYRTAVVDHRVDGKVDSKKLVSFGAGKEAFEMLSKAQQGDIFDINSQKVKNEKDGKEYWTWISATPAGKADGTSAAKAPSVAVRSSYETTEERAARQVYIVRQSSVSSAIALLDSVTKGKFNTDDVIEVAKQFEDYVFNGVKEVVEPAEVQ